MRITNVTILHGYGVTPEKMWFPWIHRELERRGYAVNVPHLPDSLRPDYRKWRAAASVLARNWDEGTLVIGHSVGGAFALRLIEREAKSRIAGLVMVASPITAIVNVKPYVRFFAQPIDWERIRKAAKQVAVIHAKNDPLVSYDHAIRYGEALDVLPTIVPTGGHFIEKKCHPLMRVLRKDFGL